MMPFERQRFSWKIREGEISLAARTLISAALDLSVQASREKPDLKALVDQAQAFEEQGAALLDLTVLPTRPDGKIIDADSELRRLVPVLRKLRSNVQVPLAVATYNSETAERALELGAHIIRDPSGLAFDPKLAPKVVEAHAGLILGHGPGGPISWAGGRSIAGLSEAVSGDLDSGLARARAVGLDRRRIVFDLGLGIGKQGIQNYEILDRLVGFSKLGQPMMIASHGHRFLADSVKASEQERLISEVAFSALAARGGAHLIRTPNVVQISAAVRVADRLLEARDVEDRLSESAPAPA